jgi:hypothetical protein
VVGAGSGRPLEETAMIVADLAATPPSFTVDDKNLGCKWTAKKE